MTFSSQDKLNAMHLVGAIGIGIIAAAICNSLIMFFVVSGALILVSLVTSQIRLHGRRNRPD